MDKIKQWAIEIMKNNQKGKVLIMLTAMLAIGMSFFIAQFAVGFTEKKSYQLTLMMVLTLI